MKIPCESMVMLVLFAAVPHASDAGEPAVRGHALAPDTYALAQEMQQRARPGHALGPDIEALRTPIGCPRAPAAEPDCEIASEQ